MTDKVVIIEFNEATHTVKVDDTIYSYKTTNKGIEVYDSDGKFIGNYDSTDDLRHDIKTNPEQFTENTLVKENKTMDELFNLDINLNESKEQSLLDTPLNENTPAAAQETPVQESATEPAEKPSASVPEQGPKPEGGLKEQPATKPAEQGPSIPAKTEISQETYNSAIETLMKSFKESTAILATLQNAVITESKKPAISKEALDVFKKFVADKCKSGECKDYTAEDIEKMFTVEKEPEGDSGKK